jgi:hypothetical protein
MLIAYGLVDNTKADAPSMQRSRPVDYRLACSPSPCFGRAELQAVHVGSLIVLPRRGAPNRH